PPFFLKLLGIAFSWFKGIVEEEEYAYPVVKGALVKETLSIRYVTKDKEKELWVELKRLFEPHFEDQLWTHTQNLMHDPLDWKLYDTCGVHNVSTKDQEIFMLVERDYPLRRGLAIVMICNKLQNEHYALWEVIEFGDSCQAPPEETGKDSASESSAKKKGRTVAITTEDMQKKRNDVKERTTLLLALPDEHQLRFSKYETAQELDDLDTMSLDDVYNYLKIKYEDITQIDEDDIEEMDIKWNMALLSMRADRFWKKTGKKITIQGSDVDKSKVECFNCHKIGHFARECRARRSQDRGKRESYRQGPKEEERAPKALMVIDKIRWVGVTWPMRKRTILLLLMKKL
nr:hypothetical protein [Tanacetum cinerariifolium]